MRSTFNLLTIFLVTIIIGVCTALTIKDIRPCPNSPHPMVDSVVVVNCTDEPCFFGKVNGLSFQFVFTPERPTSSVGIQITAVDGYGSNYDIDTVQRTCAQGYCEMEAHVPRCYSAAVRRRYAPDYDQSDFFTFTVRFTDSHGTCIACSRFVLATYVKYTRDNDAVYTTSRPVYTTARPVYTTARPAHTTHRPVYTTAAPVYTTNRPVYTTSRPVYTTNRPVYTTSHPYSSASGNFKPIGAGSGFMFDKKTHDNVTDQSVD